MTFYALVRKHDGDLAGQPLNAASVVEITEDDNKARFAARFHKLEAWTFTEDRIFTKCVYAPVYEKRWYIPQRFHKFAHRNTDR